MWPPTDTPTRGVKLPSAIAGITPLRPRKLSVPTRTTPPLSSRTSLDTCRTVSASLATTLADDAILFFSVVHVTGDRQLYATRVSKEVRDDNGGVVLRLGVPTSPSRRRASPYPSGRAAECLELDLSAAGCKLEYLQTRAKYFLPKHFDDPLANIPLRRCTQPYMEEGAAPWGKVWLEVTRQLCLRLGLRYLDLADESSITLPSGQLVSLARLKLLTDGATWYERVLHAVPASEREARAYARTKARLATLRWRDVKSVPVRTAIAEIVALSRGAPLKDSDPIGGKTGVAARLIASAGEHAAGTLRALQPLGLHVASACEHGNAAAAVSTLLRLLFGALKLIDPYGTVWRADLAAARPLVEGVVVHGYQPADQTDAILLASPAKTRK